MNKSSKIIFIIGISLLLYGYLSRLMNLFFFWESKYVGWSVLVLGVITYLFYRSGQKKSLGKKSRWEKIGIFLLVFFLFVQTAILFIFPTTAAYEAGMDFLHNSRKLQDEVGKIKRISLIPLGMVQSRSVNGVQSGYATLYFIVKGDKKYKDVQLSVIKRPEFAWVVEEED